MTLLFCHLSCPFCLCMLCPTGPKANASNLLCIVYLVVKLASTVFGPCLTFSFVYRERADPVVIQGRIHSVMWPLSPQLTGTTIAHISASFVLCVYIQGRRCVLKDCCKILDNTVLPPETVVPPFTVFSGCPGQLHHTDTDFASDDQFFYV